MSERFSTLYKPTTLEESYGYYLLEHVLRVLQFNNSQNAISSSSYNNNNQQRPTFYLSGQVAVPFLSSSGVDRSLLREMWNIIDPSHLGCISNDVLTFCSLLKLIALAQQNIGVIRDAFHQGISAIEGLLCHRHLLQLAQFASVPVPNAQYLLSTYGIHIQYSNALGIISHQQQPQQQQQQQNQPSSLLSVSDAFGDLVASQDAPLPSIDAAPVQPPQQEEVFQGQDDDDFGDMQSGDNKPAEMIDPSTLEQQNGVADDFGDFAQAETSGATITATVNDAFNTMAPTQNIVSTNMMDSLQPYSQGQNQATIFSSSNSLPLSVETQPQQQYISAPEDDFGDFNQPNSDQETMDMSAIAPPPPVDSNNDTFGDFAAAIPAPNPLIEDPMAPGATFSNNEKNLEQSNHDGSNDFGDFTSPHQPLDPVVAPSNDNNNDFGDFVAPIHDTKNQDITSIMPPATSETDDIFGGQTVSINQPPTTSSDVFGGGTVVAPIQQEQQQLGDISSAFDSLVDTGLENQPLPSLDQFHAVSLANNNENNNEDEFGDFVDDTAQQQANGDENDTNQNIEEASNVVDNDFGDFVETTELPKDDDVYRKQLSQDGTSDDNEVVFDDDDDEFGVFHDASNEDDNVPQPVVSKESQEPVDLVTEQGNDEWKSDTVANDEVKFEDFTEAPVSSTARTASAQELPPPSDLFTSEENPSTLPTITGDVPLSMSAFDALGGTLENKPLPSLHQLPPPQSDDEFGHFEEGEMLGAIEGEATASVGDEMGVANEPKEQEQIQQTEEENNVPPIDNDDEFGDFVDNPKADEFDEPVNQDAEEGEVTPAVTSDDQEIAFADTPHDVTVEKSPFDDLAVPDNPLPTLDGFNRASSEPPSNNIQEDNGDNDNTSPPPQQDNVAFDARVMSSSSHMSDSPFDVLGVQDMPLPSLLNKADDAPSTSSAMQDSPFDILGVQDKPLPSLLGATNDGTPHVTSELDNDAALPFDGMPENRAPADESFGSFGQAPDIPDNEPAKDNIEADLTGANDDLIGSAPQPAADVVDESFGDFGEFVDTPPLTDTAVAEATPQEPNEAAIAESFADFKEAKDTDVKDPTQAITNANVTVAAEVDEGFGDFGEFVDTPPPALPDETAAPENFGNFGEATTEKEAPENQATESAAVDMMDEDFGDFGDFVDVSPPDLGLGATIDNAKEKDAEINSPQIPAEDAENKEAVQVVENEKVDDSFGEFGEFAEIPSDNNEAFTGATPQDSEDAGTTTGADGNEQVQAEAGTDNGDDDFGAFGDFAAATKPSPGSENMKGPDTGISAFGAVPGETDATVEVPTPQPDAAIPQEDEFNAFASAGDHPSKQVLTSAEPNKTEPIVQEKVEEEFDDFGDFGDFTDGVSADASTNAPLDREPDGDFVERIGRVPPPKTSRSIDTSTMTTMLGPSDNGWDAFQKPSKPVSAPTAEKELDDSAETILDKARSLVPKISRNEVFKRTDATFVDMQALLAKKKKKVSMIQARRLHSLLEHLASKDASQMAHVWKRSLEAICKEMILGVSLLQEATDLSQDDVKALSKSLSTMVAGLGEFVRIARSIVAAIADLFMLGNEEGDGGWSEAMIRQKWHSLALLEPMLLIEKQWGQVIKLSGSLQLEPVGMVESVGQIRQSLLESSNPSSPPLLMCQLTLRQLDASSAGTTKAVEWEGRHFMACSANFWLYRVAPSFA